jgi:hypothetical protein
MGAATGAGVTPGPAVLEDGGFTAGKTKAGAVTKPVRDSYRKIAAAPPLGICRLAANRK